MLFLFLIARDSDSYTSTSQSDCESSDSESFGSVSSIGSRLTPSKSATLDDDPFPDIHAESLLLFQDVKIVGSLGNVYTC